MNEEQRKRIIEQETAAFLDPQFGQLDLSSYPELAKPATETFETEDKHGLNRVDTSGLGTVNRLKELISNPDRAALAELARDNPEIAAQLQEDRATEIARQFVAANPRYLQTDRNFERIVSYLLQKHLGQDLRIYEDADEATLALLAAGVWSVPEITAAFRNLLRQGELDSASNEPRYLTAEEKLRCEQIAANGDILTAIGDYV